MRLLVRSWSWLTGRLGVVTSLMNSETITSIPGTYLLTLIDIVSGQSNVPNLAVNAERNPDTWYWYQKKMRKGLGRVRF